MLLRLDLQDFFPAFPAARVQALFRTLGYPETVADRLGGICTNAVHADVWSGRPLEIGAREWQEARTLYARPHLPQGAPTSPALANLTAYRLDCRLSGLARTAGAVYTRYADDLAFSGGEEFTRVSNDSRRTPPRLRLKKASASITIRLASCGKAFDSSSPELW